MISSAYSHGFFWLIYSHFDHDMIWSHYFLLESVPILLTQKNRGSIFTHVWDRQETDKNPGDIKTYYETRCYSTPKQANCKKKRKQKHSNKIRNENYVSWLKKLPQDKKRIDHKRTISFNCKNHENV